MLSREIYNALEAIDTITQLKNSGKTEEEIALEFGFEKKGKPDISEFRQYLMAQKQEARELQARKVRALMDSGYSIDEASKTLGISEATGRSLSLYYLLHVKEKNNEKTD